MEYSGAGGKLIHEKNQKQKISWHCPFKGLFWLQISNLKVYYFDLKIIVFHSDFSIARYAR